MIQDIFPHTFNNTFIETNGIQKNDHILYFRNNALLLHQLGEKFEIPRKKDLIHNGEVKGIYLFSLNEIPCYLVEECEVPVDSSFVFHEFNFFRTLYQREIAWASIVGLQLMNWYAQNRYCGKCGFSMNPKQDERALSCSSCEHIEYPHISPAIIVAITCGDKILLAKGTHFKGNFYSLIAGYADVGESLEDTVIREVKEEVGIDVTGIRYYKSQPWPFSGSMMIGFFAVADDRQPIRCDEHEIEDAAWFSKDNLPLHSTTISIAGEMIELFAKSEKLPV